MKYYTSIKMLENGRYEVIPGSETSCHKKLAMYRVNFPNESANVERIGPYTVEEKVGSRWVKIGIVGNGS